MDLKEKILGIIGIIVAGWLICPLPEISIIVGLFGGESVNRLFGVPRWMAWAFSGIGAVVGFFVVRRLGWWEKAMGLLN